MLRVAEEWGNASSTRFSGKIGFVDDQIDRVSLFVVCIAFIQFLCERV